MRYARDHKQRTHARILEAAGKVFRERGYTGAGIDSVMEQAGLTPGGFYAHFASKEVLLVETLTHALRQTRAELLAGIDDQEGLGWLQAIVHRYLSRSHRDAVLNGCAIPALISEIARSGAAPKEAFEHLIRQLVDAFERKMPGQQGQTSAERALATIAICIGGLALARAVQSPALSNQILKACREFAVPENASSKL